LIKPAKGILSERNVIIWDIDQANVIYFSGFFGKPMNIKKPKGPFKEPLVLDPIESIVGYTADLLNKNDLKSSNRVSINATILEKPYDVIRVNKAAIQEDLVFLAKFYEEKKISNNKIGKYGIYSNGDFYIEDNVFLDTRSGPIVIEDGAYIQAFTRIEGPSYIGKNAQIVSFCNIRKSYIGNHCVVGGELSNSIILDYTNSRHSSYIGDSYIATWVNIGAHTVTSNLKHTYGIIRYDDLGKIYQTGLTKFGAIISDFSKTSIGCLILSGKSTGFSSIVNFYKQKVFLALLFGRE
jgi:N-acetylglucosamine-1-phosphate uridyltransferase (contains nucleotidyltransferase and I-patch acetyltransferase domains)